MFRGGMFAIPTHEWFIDVYSIVLPTFHLNVCAFRPFWDPRKHGLFNPPQDEDWSQDMEESAHGYTWNVTVVTRPRDDHQKRMARGSWQQKWGKKNIKGLEVEMTAGTGFRCQGSEIRLICWPHPHWWCNLFFDRKIHGKPPVASNSPCPYFSCTNMIGNVI